MYHIKDDKRAAKSSELIYQGLISCMKDKDFSKISITDIQRTSTVGRATFYRHFDSMIDVLHWKCDQEYHNVMNSYVSMETHEQAKDEFFIYFFDYWTGHSEVLETLIRLGRYDIIYQCHYSNAPILYEYFKQAFKIPKRNYKYYMGFRIGAFVGVLITWINGGKKESSKELVKIIVDLLKDADADLLI